MALTVQTVPIDSVHPDPANAREHGDKNLLAIRTSLARFGQQKPIVVTEDGVIIAGNGMWRAAKDLGWTEIVIARTSLKNAEATAYSLVDNRSSDLSTWDVNILKSDLTAIKSDKFNDDALSNFGFSESEMKKLFYVMESQKVPSDDEWIDAFDGGCDADEIMDKKQITFVIHKSDHHRLINHLKKFDDDKNIALIKWLSS